MDRVPGVHPFAKEDVSVFQAFLQYGTLYDRPLLEQVVLGMHSFGNQMASTLENQLTVRAKMDADVRAVDLLLHNQRFIGNEVIGLHLAKMLVVIRPLGAEQVRSPGVLDKVVVRATHDRPRLSGKLPSASVIRVRRVPAQRHGTRPCNQTSRPIPSPKPETRARVHSNRWSSCRKAPAARVGQTTLYSRLGVVSTTVPGRANSNNTRSKAAKRGGSRCSTTSTTAAASNPANRLSRYVSEPCRSRMRALLPSGHVVEPQPILGNFQ